VIELSVAVIDHGGKNMALPVIPDEMARAAQEAALAAHAALRCEGYSRSDMIAADDGMHLLRLNTLPDWTTSSLMAKALRAAGIDFREFLEAQIEFARKRTLNASRPASRSAP